MGSTSQLEHIPTSWDRLLPILALGTNGKRYSFNFESFPLSTGVEVAVVLAVYLSTLFIIKTVMKNFEPLKLKGVALVHNLLLSVGSALLLTALAMEVLPSLWNDGLFPSICGTAIFNGRLEYLYYINYLFKVYELFDTILLVFKKHDLTFLHVYHHCLTFVLCYTQFVGQSTVQWVPITLNLIVHTFMYWYYAMASIGVPCRWKKYLTTMQIIQFVLDIGFCYYCAGVLIAHLSYGYEATCHGTVNAAIFGSLLLTSYLWLFIDFYKKTYGPKTDSSRRTKPKRD